MPPVAPIIAGVGGFLATPIGSIIGNLAFSVGLSAVSNALRPKPPSQQVTTRRGLTFELTLGESMPVSAVFGLGRANGHLIYVNEYGTNNDWLQMVIAIGHGEHDGLHAFLVDEKVSALTGSNGSARGRVVEKYRLNEDGEEDANGTPHMWVKFYTGAPGQTADPELVANANPGNRWGNMHRATGMAYMIVTMRYTEAFGSTVPRIGSVWRGLKFYDWRKDDTMPGGEGPHRWGQPETYEFTANPVVMRWNFRRGIHVNGVRVLGQGFPLHANDIAGYTAAANICDEEIFDPVTVTTYTRYEFGREIYDDEEKLEVLASFEAGFAGASFKRGGADVPLPAAQKASVMTLTNNDRLKGEPIRADRRGVVSDKRTAWHGQYLSKDNDWRPAPYSTRINSALETALNGRRSAALDQPFEHLETRAQARAEIALRRDAFPGTRVETFTPKALPLEPGDVVTRVCDWGSVTMMIEEKEVLEGRIGVRLTLREWSNTIVPASGESFVALPPENGIGPGNPNRLVTLSGLGAVPYDQTGGGAIHPAIRFTWNEIVDPTVDQVIIRYWPAAGNREADGKLAFGSRFNRALVVTGVAPQTEYHYEGTIACNPARATVWTNLGYVVTGLEEVPAVPPPGSVDVNALSNRLAGAVGTILTDREGSISSLLEAVDERVEQVAASLARLTANNEAELRSTRTTIRAQRAASTAIYDFVQNVVATEISAMSQTIEILAAKVADNEAAIFEERTARVEGEEAQALINQELAAITDFATAGGMVGWEVASGPGGGTVRYRLVGRVVAGGNVGEFGLFGDINSDLSSQMLFVADRFYFWDGNTALQPVSIEASTLTFKQGKFELLTSLDGETIVLDGLTGDFSYGRT